MDPALQRKDGCADLLPPSRLAPRPAGDPVTVLVLAPTHRGVGPFRARPDGLGGLATLERESAAHGIVPTYVVDHGLAADARQLEPLLGLLGSGRAQLGALLVPALTPPLDGTPPPHLPGNLKRDLEREKLEVLLERIQGRSGQRPKVYMAPRGGVGKSSPSLLAEAGLCVDASALPGHDLRSEGGADFRAFPPVPYFYPGVPELLGVPQSGALLSPLCGAVDALGAVCLRLGLGAPVTLDPGLHGAGALARLAAVLLSRGARTLTVVAYPEDFTGPKGERTRAHYAELLQLLFTRHGARAGTHMGLWEQVGRMPEVEGPYSKSRRARS